MKKIYLLLFIITCVCMIMAGCSGQQAGSKQPGNDAENISQSDDSDRPNSQAQSQKEDSQSHSDIDVDLTKLSSTMVYAEVYNMMTNPDKYMGKTVKMSGVYRVTYLEETKKYYHFVVIEDATACCEQGVEFIWNGNDNYPDDYPPDGEPVEATGIFGNYEELEETYYYIAVDHLIRK